MKKILHSWRYFITESKQVEKYFTEVALNTMSAADVFADEEVIEEGPENLSYEVSVASNPEDEIVQKFYDSLYAGKRSGFLSPYTLDELALMDLYLLEGHHAGFAIKDGDDIVSVHNNSDLRGLGSEFLRMAKESGGARLDHFDGFLSGLYRAHGFTDVYEIYQWDEQYQPAAWDYPEIDIADPATSVYAAAIDELIYENPETLPNKKVEIVAEDDFPIAINPNLKYNSYRYGRPDVIMRKLG